MRTVCLQIAHTTCRPWRPHSGVGAGAARPGGQSHGPWRPGLRIQDEGGHALLPKRAQAGLTRGGPGPHHQHQRAHRVVAVDAARGKVTVEGGVTLGQLIDAAAKAGLGLPYTPYQLTGRRRAALSTGVLLNF